MALLPHQLRRLQVDVETELLIHPRLGAAACREPPEARTAASSHFMDAVVQARAAGASCGAQHGLERGREPLPRGAMALVVATWRQARAGEGVKS